MYVVYDNDGIIDQTVIGPDETYGPEILDKVGYNWLFLPGQNGLDISKVHVDTVAKTIKPNMDMALTVSKNALAADGADVCLVGNIPANSLVQIFCNGDLQMVETVTDGQIEFATVTAATYGFMVSCKLYLPTQFEVIAQ